VTPFSRPNSTTTDFPSERRIVDPSTIATPQSA
jgi:hypothetical protein